MAEETSNPNLVDDFYFSVLSDEGEIIPVSDEKYAEGLQLQEALMSSVISSQIANGSPIIEETPMKDVGESSQCFCEICLETGEMFTNMICTHSFCINIPQPNHPSHLSKHHCKKQMESGGEPSLPDWEKPITQEELDAIEAAFDSASSSLIKRRRPSTSTYHKDIPYKSRRLPNSMLSPQHSSTLNPHQVKLKMKYATMNFGGRIIYSRTATEVEKATIELLEIIEAKKRNMDQVILGFDIEWRPTFKRGVACRKAAVMQICGDPSHCYVMHIIHSGIPPILRSLLEDSASLKVGVCIANDAVKVLKDYNVCIKALEDLSTLANLKLGGISRKWSLSCLTEMLTCTQLEKPNKIRLGNWEADVLSREQLQYAATDAFASWYLFEVLKSFPDAANNQNEE